MAANNLNNDSFSLEKEAPTLFKYRSVGTGFETPKNYFDSIESNILQIIHKPHFEIPEGYFNTIEDNVFAKINSEQQVKVISFRQIIIKKVAPILVAASITLLLMLTVFNQPSNQDVFASLDAAQIESWIDDGSIDVSSEDIAAVYLEDEIETIDLFSDYSEDDYLNYLDNIDIESLILTN
ncbi:hypothetical protein KH5_21030 [Urechidicola sp. KH5]